MSAQNPSMPRLDRSDAARARFAALLERHRGITVAALRVLWVVLEEIERFERE